MSKDFSNDWKSQGKARLVLGRDDSEKPPVATVEKCYKYSTQMEYQYTDDTITNRRDCTPFRWKLKPDRHSLEKDTIY